MGMAMQAVYNSDTSRSQMLQMRMMKDPELEKCIRKMYSGPMKFPIRFMVLREFIDNHKWDDLAIQDAERYVLGMRKNLEFFLSEAAVHVAVREFLDYIDNRSCKDVIHFIQESLRHENISMECSGSVNVKVQEFEEFVKKTQALHSAIECIDNSIRILNDSQNELRNIYNTDGPEILDVASKVQNQRIELVTYLKRNVLNLEILAEIIFKKVDEYCKQEKLKHRMNTPGPKEGDLDFLNKISDEFSKIMKKIWGVNIQLGHLVEQLQLIQDGVQPDLLENEDTNLILKRLLHIYMQKLTLIEIDKESNHKGILKVGDRKKGALANCTISVKILGACSLFDSAEIMNVKCVGLLDDEQYGNIELDPSSRHFEKRTGFHGRDLLNWKGKFHLTRFENARKSHSHNASLKTDFKYVVQLSLKLNVFKNFSLEINVRSDEIIFITHQSQIWHPQGLLLWDVLFPDKESVPWSHLTDSLIQPYVKHWTHKELNEDQLFYLFKKYKNHQQINCHDPSKIIEKNVFLKESIVKSGGGDTSSFSLWKFIYCSVNTLKRPHINSEWKEDYIMGFISHGEADKKLSSGRVGMCLVRFRETKLEETKGQEQGAKLCLTIVTNDGDGDGTKPRSVPIPENELRKANLSYYLSKVIVKDNSGNQVLKYIYPDKVITPLNDCDSNRNGYYYIGNAPILDLRIKSSKTSRQSSVSTDANPASVSSFESSIYSNPVSPDYFQDDHISIFPEMSESESNFNPPSVSTIEPTIFNSEGEFLSASFLQLLDNNYNDSGVNSLNNLSYS